MIVVLGRTEGLNVSDRILCPSFHHQFPDDRQSILSETLTPSVLRRTTNHSKEIELNGATVNYLMFMVFPPCKPSSLIALCGIDHGSAEIPGSVALCVRWFMVYGLFIKIVI